MKKGMKNSPSAYWCYLRSNSKLRLAIKTRLKERRLKQIQVAELTSIPVYRISRYLLGRHPSLTQFQLITLSKALGVSVKLQVTLE